MSRENISLDHLKNISGGGTIAGDLARELWKAGAAGQGAVMAEKMRAQEYRAKKEGW